MHQNGLEKLVGLQIGITYSLLTIQLQKMLEPCRLSPKEAVVLWLAAENPGVTQTELSTFLGVGRSTILQVVQALKRALLVEPRTMTRDRRMLGLHVTPAGATVLARARAIIDRHEALIRVRIAPETCDLVLDSMQLLR